MRNTDEIDEVKHLRNLFQLSPFIMYLLQVEPEIEFKLINDVIEDFIGYSPQEHYDDPDLGSKLIDPDYTEVLLDYTEKALNGESENFVLKWKDKSGETKWSEQKLVLYPIDGKAHLIGYAQDVTEREELKSQVKKISSMIRVCSYCEKIFDKDNWIHTQEYLKKITGRNFTHGICNSCLEDNIKKMKTK